MALRQGRDHTLDPLERLTGVTCAAISAPPLSGGPLAGTPVDSSRLFPSEDKTQFGDWVKAGALKAGDQVSTRDSVGQTGPRIASNDNTPLTITDIIRDSATTRVYNFEAASGPNEITHNYFVGDDQAWVHNAGIPRVSPKILRKAWEDFWGMKWPKDPATGWNQDACHILAIADGGSNCVCNIKPMTRKDHIAEHVANGDFSRWAKRLWGGKL